MAQFSFSGTLNTAALVVPDLYVVTAPPQVLQINGIPTNIVGICGTAPYGPVNTPIVGGTAGDYITNFGYPVARKYDMGTHVFTALQQGATAFSFVRVTDSTDTAATAASQTNNSVVSPSFVAPFTGSGGAGTTVTIQPGRAAGSWAAIVSRPGRVSERFDANFTTWGAIITAINGGVPTMNQPASQMVIAVIGSATVAGVPSAMVFTLAGGTDGATGITQAEIVGTDGLIPTGAFCLRGQGCLDALAADVDSVTYWPTLDALAQSEGIYWHHCYPSGTSVLSSTTTQPSLSFSPYSKVLHGDWIYWYDTSNTVTRVVSPQGFSAGKLSALGPQESGLNKQMAGVIGTQYTGQNGGNAYSIAQLQALFLLDIDLITSPSPGGSFWALRLGHNASGNPGVKGDNYPRLTSFIARSLAGGMGLYVGQVINSSLLLNIRSTLLGFLGNLLQQGILGSADGSIPYAVVCDTSNNPASRTALGYVQADVQVRYMGINEKFICNLQGGQGVTVSTENNQTGA